MKPRNFKQSTKVLTRPSSMPKEKCGDLPVWTDGKECVSCWKPSFKERLYILFHGKVWLGVLSGGTQPPVFVLGESPFVRTPIKAQIKAFILSVKESIARMRERLVEAAEMPDKKKHFVAGFLIAAIVGVILNIWWSCGWVCGFFAACAAGIAKEYWDSKGNGTVEFLDFVFTAFGAIFGASVALFIHAIF